MPHMIWKGAVSFGLVHIPVALYPASHEDSIDFDWLDKRSMDPVGYKRINKRTGKEIDKAHIVKGIKRDADEYVVLNDEDIAAAYPKSTQTIEIEAFVQASEIGFVHLERPYYLAPIGKGAKVYALLRETLLDAGRVGLARVVIATKEHLAAVIAVGPALMLNTLRWAAEIRPWTELDLPQEGRKSHDLKDSDLKMARQLVASMATPWRPERYEDRFRKSVMALVDAKVKAGDTNRVEALEAAPESSTNVVDLTELLKRSLKSPANAARPGPAARKTAPQRTSATRKQATKEAAKRA